MQEQRTRKTAPSTLDSVMAVERACFAGVMYETAIALIADEHGLDATELKVAHFAAQVDRYDRMAGEPTDD
jgi:hypothetical protein